MEAFQEKPIRSFSARGMFWGSYQSTLWETGLWNFTGKHWTGSTSLNSRSVSWTRLFQAITKGLSQLPRGAFMRLCSGEDCDGRPLPSRHGTYRTSDFLGKRASRIPQEEKTLASPATRKNSESGYLHLLVLPCLENPDRCNQNDLGK